MHELTSIFTFSSLSFVYTGADPFLLTINPPRDYQDTHRAEIDYVLCIAEILKLCHAEELICNFLFNVCVCDRQV